jgi:hypothetical protein
MIDAVNKTYSFLELLFSDMGAQLLTGELERADTVPQWNDPEFCLSEKEARAVVRQIVRRQKEGLVEGSLVDKLLAADGILATIVLSRQGDMSPRTKQLRRKRKTRN